MFSSTQYVMNIQTGAIGQVYSVVLSPIGTEDARGIRRVMVMTDIPGSDGTYRGFDWWLIEDCILLPQAPIASGVTVELSLRKTFVMGVVLSSNYADVCVMLADGSTGFVALSRVQSIALPLTNSSLQIA